MYQVVTGCQSSVVVCLASDQQVERLSLLWSMYHTKIHLN